MMEESQANEDQQIEFDKAPGTSGASKGHKYEIKLVMLFLLQGKLTKEIDSFYLAANMDGVGAFDDLVFQYTFKENHMKKTRILFLQAKHKEENTKNVNFKSLLSKAEKGDFSLKKYLSSYKKIKQRFQLNKDHLIFKNNFEDSDYFIYTNASFNFNNCEEHVKKCEVKQELFLNLRENYYYKIKGSEEVISALGNSPNSDISDEDIEIGGFLEKLRIFGGQYNEKELENKIIKTIKSAYSVKNREANLIYSDVYNEVETWWLNNKMKYLTKNNVFFERAKQNVSKFSLVGLASLGRAQIETLKLNFKSDHVRRLKELIYKNQILNIVTKTITFTNAKVCQVLESMPEYKSENSEEFEYKYMFVSSVLNIQDKVIDSFESTKIKLLVLVCDYTEENFQEIYQDLFDVIEENHDKKIIMIMKENMIDTEFESMFSKTGKFSNEKYNDKTETLFNLTEESEEKLKSKVNATLQGEKVNFSSLLQDNKMKELVNEEILSELVTTSRINIGDSLNNLGEVEKYYIIRTFDRTVKIKEDFKNDISSFFVTRNCEIADKTIEPNKDIVLISDIENYFYKICADDNYKTNNIHWLKEDGGRLTWQQSHGSLSTLRTFIDTDCSNNQLVKEEDIINTNERVVIISAEPGMGKSTVLTKLAEQIKKSDPSLWVQTINLNNHTDNLQAMDLNQNKKEEIIKVLLDIVKPSSVFEAGLLNRRINEEGKIVFLFDGFDEICPTFNNKVIEMLNVLKNTKAEKLWITTRPHLRNELEDKLGVIAYTIRPLTRDNQETFLKNFWKAGLGINKEFDNRCDPYICQLLDLLKKSITDRELEFTGVPLQTRMLAEVFHDTFKDFYDALEEEEPNLPEKLDLVDLYKTFIDKKCEILYKEKKETSLTKPTTIRDYEEFFYPTFLRNHKFLGINLIFSDNEVNILLSKQEKNELKILKDKFNEKDDKTGILIQVINDRPIFLHRTYAEYFSAIWFAEKIQENNEEVRKFLLENIFKKQYQLLQIFLDRVLTKNDDGKIECKIHNAVLNNNKSEVNALLDSPKLDEVQIFDKGGRTALHLAVIYGYETILKVLLKNSKIEESIFKNKIDTKDIVFNWSALTYAVKCNYWNIVELLLQSGAKSDDMFESNSGIDVMNDKRETLLHIVAKEGYVNITEVLIKRGDDVHAKNTDLSTPLHVAAEFGNDNVMKILLKHANKYQIDCEDIQGRTPLYRAANNGKLDICKLLVDNGANINANNASGPAWGARNWSILHIAAYEGNKEIAEYLINKQADVNAVNSNGNDPLYISIIEGKEEVTSLLEKTGSNSFLIYTSLGKFDLVEGILKDKSKEERKRLCNPITPGTRGPLHIAAQKGHQGIVKLLIKNGADLLTFDKDGFTPLHISAEEDHMKLLKFLMKKEKLLNNGEFDILKVCDLSGWTILHSAAMGGRTKIINRFIKSFKHNAESVEDLINVVDSKGFTLLLAASKFGKLDTVKFLVENNANINAADLLGATSLYYAAANNHHEIVKYLLDQKGINIYCDSNTFFGMIEFTPLHLAIAHDNLDMAKLLLEKSRSLLGAGEKIGITPLHFASLFDNSITYQYLVDEGANTDVEINTSNIYQIIDLFKEGCESKLDWVKCLCLFFRFTKGSKFSRDFVVSLVTPELSQQNGNKDHEVSWILPYVMQTKKSE